MKNSEEGCILQEQQAELSDKVQNIDARLTKVEADVGKMRSETQEGFRHGAEAMQQISKSVSDLAHDFGDRMNTIDKRLVAEKEKWGETLRWVVKMAVRVLLAGAAVAMGVTTLRMFMK
jgi:outer membrane murein-binding lipoprotein Lpp